MTSTMANPFTEMFDVDYPIVCAPMFLVSYPDLIVGACEAGAMGTFPAANFRTHEEFVGALEEIKSRTTRAFGVNLSLRRNDNLEANMGACLEHEVALIITSLGDPSAIIKATRGTKTRVFSDVINQRHGYAAGDRLLRQVGGLIGRMVRGEDLSARFDGEEFCVVMPETPSDIGAQVLRRIADVVMMTEFGVVMDEAPITMGLKLGCTGLETGDTPETLLARAHSALA